ncbi:MAG TPA: hypothetical protein VJU13_03030 [Candidatus Nitrosocosmicus sp.]|nr:hypothetical protein [Candidatus Nitrosocosmicus sp.]
MKTVNLISLISTLIIIVSIIGVSNSLSMADAQTPTTSDLPATIGNESTSDMSLTNNSVPVENITTVTPVSPPV